MGDSRDEVHCSLCEKDFKVQQLASLKQHCRTNRHGTRREAKRRKREEEEARETLESTDPEVEIETHPIISAEDIKTEMPEEEECPAEDTGDSKEGEEAPFSDSAAEPCSPLKSNKDREREQEKRRKERWMEWKEGIKVLPMGDGEEEGEDGTSGQRQKCS